MEMKLTCTGAPVTYQVHRGDQAGDPEDVFKGRVKGAIPGDCPSSDDSRYTVDPNKDWALSQRTGCLLTICGTGTVLLGSIDILYDVSTSGGPTEICFSGTVNASFLEGAKVSGVGNLRVQDRATLTLDNSVTFDRSPNLLAEDSSTVSVVNREWDLRAKDGENGIGLVLRGNASATVHSTAFLVVRCSQDCDGFWRTTPLHASDNSTLVLSNSSFSQGKGAWGGAVHLLVSGNARVTLADASFLGGSGGPAIVVRDNSTLTLARCNISGYNVTTNAYDDCGGGIFVTGDASVIMANSTLRDNFASGIDLYAPYDYGGDVIGGAVGVSGNAMVHITGSDLVNNSAAQCGGVAVYDHAKLTLENSRIVGNAAEMDGGGVCATGNATLAITECIIEGNSAKNGSGGGLYAELATSNYIITITDTTITDNIAKESGGGAVVGNVTNIVLNGATLSNNSATQSGGGLFVADNANIRLENQVVFLLNKAGTVADELQASVNATIGFMGASIGVCSPGVLWLTRNCTVGQVMDAGYCQCCPANTYTPVVGATSCDACPANANCTGGDAIVPLAGFWHSHKYSSQLHRCPRPEACLYGGICAEGHTGNACGSCASGYGSLSPFHCRKCLARGSIIAIYFGVTAAAFFLVSYLVHSTLEDNVQGVAASRPSDYLKLLIRHLQYLVIIGSLQIEWPAALTGIFAAAGAAFSAAGSAGVVAMECVLTHNSSVPVRVQKLLLQLGLPIVVMVAVLLVRGLVCAVSRGARQVPASVILVVSCLVGLFTFLPFFVRSGLSLFACYSLDASTSDPYPEFAVANASRGYWVHDMGQACWQGWHKAWAVGLGVPLVAALCVGVPLGTLLLLVLNRRRLGEAGFKAYVGFLYHQYSARCFYWEAVSSLQVMLLTAISVFSYTLGAFHSNILLNVLLVLFWVLQQVFKPSAFKDLHFASFASIGCLYATTCVAATLFTPLSKAPTPYKAAAGIGVLVANAMFLLGSLVVIVVKSKEPVAKACRKVLNWLLGSGWSEGPDVGEQKPSIRESTLAAV